MQWFHYRKMQYLIILIPSLHHLHLFLKAKLHVYWCILVEDSWPIIMIRADICIEPGLWLCCIDLINLQWAMSPISHYWGYHPGTLSLKVQSMQLVLSLGTSNHRLHLQEPNLQVSCGDTTAMRGYRDSTLIASFMGPTWGPSGGWQDPGGPYVGPMNLAI